MKAIFRGCWILMMLWNSITAKAALINEAAFRLLPDAKSRIDFLQQEFSPAQKGAFLQLLPLLEAQNDQEATLFWHYRYYTLADSFGLNGNDQQVQLRLMNQKALGYRNRIGVIVSEAYLLIQQYKLKLISSIQLYKRILPYFEEMQKIGFNKFVRYDLNAMITIAVADLSNYWGSQPANSLQYLKIAERYVSNTANGRKYHILTINGLFNAYYHQHDLPNFYQYGWQLYRLNHPHRNQGDAPTWVSRYWQAYALSQMAIINHEHVQPEARGLAKEAFLTSALGHPN